MASRRARARAMVWALFGLCWGPAAAGQDILLSPKEQATSIHLGDTSYDPGDGFPLGPFRLHPFLRQQGEFDDNLFLEEEDVTLGLYYQATGGLRVDLLPGAHEISAGYKGRAYALLFSQGPSFEDGEAEARYESRIEALTRLEHVAQLRGALGFPWGRFALTGVYERLSDPLNFAYTRHIRRDVWSGEFEGAAEWNRARFEGGAALIRYDFHGAFDYLDDVQWQVFGRAGWRVGSKFHLFAEYLYGRIEYGDLSASEESLFGSHGDLELHRVSGGARGHVTSKLEVLLQGGATYQRILGGPEQGGRTGFFGQVKVLWTATERLSFEGDYLRDVQISQLSSYQIVDRGELKGTWWFSPRAFAKVYTYVENTAPSEGEDFFRYAVGFQIEYRLYRWLSSGCGWEWRARECDLPGSRFRNHRVFGHLTLIF